MGDTDTLGIGICTENGLFKFSVYASVVNGTNAYGMTGGTEANKIHYTVKYGDLITGVYCDKYSDGTYVFRLDNGPTSTYSQFKTSDVSLTKPN